MLKNIIISGLLCSLLVAESFDNFLQRAIENSPYLKSSALGVEQAKEEGSIITRYKNPSLELEYSRFEPDFGDSDNGFRANLTQPIRLLGVGEDRERFSHATIESANALLIQKRATFIRDISLSYTLYSEQKMLLSLGNEELKIAEKIYGISKARYEVGTISRGVMLQSKVAFEMIKIRNESLSLVAMQKYYDLLKQAGVNQEIQLDTEYKFVNKASVDNSQNPKVLSLYREQKKALSQEAIYSNKIEWINLYAEYENEPEQDIARVGISLPLTLFNTKSQEKQIARLKAKEVDLLIQNENTQLNIQSNRLQKQDQTLLRLKNQNTEILVTELELLEMFKDGYKISNINLLELQDIKNRVIETKVRLIQIKTALNKNAIISNYMQGSYNE